MNGTDIDADLQVNWPNFYQTLTKYGPTHLVSGSVFAEMVMEDAYSSTDVFWSEELQNQIESSDSPLELNVRKALELWMGNIRGYFKEFPYEFDDLVLDDLAITDEESLIGLLVESLTAGPLPE